MRAVGKKGHRWKVPLERWTETGATARSCQPTEPSAASLCGTSVLQLGDLGPGGRWRVESSKEPELHLQVRYIVTWVLVGGKVG